MIFEKEDWLQGSPADHKKYEYIRRCEVSVREIKSILKLENKEIVVTLGYLESSGIVKRDVPGFYQLVRMLEKLLENYTDLNMFYGRMWKMEHLEPVLRGYVKFLEDFIEEVKESLGVKL